MDEREDGHYSSIWKSDSKIMTYHNFCHQTLWGDMGRGSVALTAIREHIHMLPQQQMHIGFERLTLFNFAHSDCVGLRP